MVTKVAVIGAGGMAAAHCYAFNDIKGVELVGVVSRTRVKAHQIKQRFSIDRVYESISELWDKTNPDIVVIAVNETSTLEVCEVAFRYPWVCLIEKPVGLGLSESSRILKLAASYGTRAFVAMNRRQYFSTRILRRELDNIESKRVVQVFDQEDPAKALLSGVAPEVVSKWEYANSVHLIDYFTFLCRGCVTSVDRVVKLGDQRPLFTLSTISFSSGDLGVYQAVWDSPGPWAVTVSTQDKRYELRPLEHAYVLNAGCRTPEKMPEHRWDSEFKPGFRLQAEEAVKASRHEKHELCSLSEAYETALLIEKLYGQHSNIFPQP